MGRKTGIPGYQVPHGLAKLLTLREVLGPGVLEEKGGFKRNYIGRYLDTYHKESGELGHPNRKVVNRLCSGIGLQRAIFETEDLVQFAEAVASLSDGKYSVEEVTKILSNCKDEVESIKANFLKQKEKMIEGKWCGWSVNIPLEHLNSIGSICAYSVEAEFKEEFGAEGNIEMVIHETITRSFHILTEKEVEEKQVTKFEGYGSRKIGSRDIKLVFYGKPRSNIDGVILLRVDRLYRKMEGYASYLDPKADVPVLAKVVLESGSEKEDKAKVQWKDVAIESIKLLAKHMQKS